MKSSSNTSKNPSFFNLSFRFVAGSLPHLLSGVTFVKNSDVCFGAKVCGPPVGTSSFLAVVSDQQSHLVSICESRGLFQNQS